MSVSSLLLGIMYQVLVDLYEVILSAYVANLVCQCNHVGLDLALIHIYV
jgi:hypothetical protein